MDRPPNPGATAADYSQHRFGGPTRPQISKVTVGTTEVELLKNNPRRLAWRLMNLGVANVFVEMGDVPSLTTSQFIGPTGGFLESTVDEDAEAVTYPLRAISSVAGNVVYVYEVIRV